MCTFIRAHDKQLTFGVKGIFCKNNDEMFLHSIKSLGLVLPKYKAIKFIYRNETFASQKCVIVLELLYVLL